MISAQHSPATTLAAMHRREGDYFVRDYLHSEDRSMTDSSVIDIDCRSKMADWCCQIVDFCKMNRRTVAYAMSTLDRFLQVTPWAREDRSVFQLASITSLYNAIKIQEPEAITIETISGLSRNAFSVEQLEEMERCILQANRWLCHPPTSFAFAHYFCEQVVATMDGRSKFDSTTLLELTELQLYGVVADYDMALHPCSTVALAAVLNSMEGMGICKTSELQVWAQRLAMVAELQDVKQLPHVQSRLHEAICAEDEMAQPLSNQRSCRHASAIWGSKASRHRPISPRSVSAVKEVSR